MKLTDKPRLLLDCDFERSPNLRRKVCFREKNSIDINLIFPQNSDTKDESTKWTKPYI